MHANCGSKIHGKRRRGFTVLEILVCIAVIGMLLSLVLPAVQNARESARLVDCRNRLRQIGLASHNFHDAHRAFPRMHRHLHSLMPYLDLKNMHDRIDEYYTNQLPLHNLESFGTAPVFTCPSGNVDSAQQEVSYLRSMGTRLDPFLLEGDSNGTLFTDFRFRKPISLSYVSDGTSNTAFWSETLSWQRTNLSNLENEPGLYWRQIARQPNTLRELQQLCLTASGRYKASGLNHTILTDNYYQHITAPNTLPCAWAPPSFTGIASKPPSSEHRGGLNVLLVDGSVQFVANTIDEATWRELGSRNSDDDFDRF